MRQTTRQQLEAARDRITDLFDLVDEASNALAAAGYHETGRTLNERTVMAWQPAVDAVAKDLAQRKGPG